MKVWAKTEHTYWDAVSRTWRRIPEGGVIDLPESVARAILVEYPEKFGGQEIRTVVMSGAPVDRQMRPHGHTRH